MHQQQQNHRPKRTAAKAAGAGRGCVETQISHFVNFTPCEEMYHYNTFDKCEIYVRSISIIFGA